MSSITALETVLTHAAHDDAFRQELLRDPEAAIARAGVVLDARDRAVLDEYRNVVSAMSQEELTQAIGEFLSTPSGQRVAAAM